MDKETICDSFISKSGFSLQILKALDSGHLDFNPQLDSIPLQRSSEEYEASGGTSISAWRKTDKKETFLLLLCVCVCLSQAVEQNKDDSHLFTPEERRELSCIEAGKVALSTILTPPPPPSLLSSHDFVMRRRSRNMKEEKKAGVDVRGRGYEGHD